MGWQPDYNTEAGLYAKHILQTVPDARIAGNLSAYGAIGKAIQAFWDMVNAEGGINGRKVTPL